MDKNDQAQRSSEQDNARSDDDSGRYLGGLTVAGGAGVVPGLRPIALVGHAYLCPVHGHEGSVIVTGSPTCKVYERPVARIGDKISCGAEIITGSKNAHIDGGRPIARLGDKGIHKDTGIVGEIVEGLDKWTLE
ncbi:MAG: PAAR domain-containing protein [Saezia sp.]